MPRRYQDDSVARLTLSDPELSKAARAGDSSALKGLCKIVSAHARDEDCARLAMVVPTTASEKERVGVFDPELVKAKYYEDPEIKALVKELEDSHWLPFAPTETPPTHVSPSSASSATSTKLRSHAAAARDSR